MMRLITIYTVTLTLLQLGGMQRNAIVVVVHDGADWKDRLAFSIRITNGDMINIRSAYTMEYLALTLATQIQQHTKGTGIYSVR